jgi:CRP/FNR family transcriptional regulator
MALEIKDIPFFHDLAQAEIQALQSCLIEKSFKKGEIIHNEGADCTVLFFVKAGRVKVYRTSSAGREQIFEVLGPGDTCACNPGELSWQCGSNAEALEDCYLWFLSRENYIRMVKANSKLMQSLNALFAKRLQCFSNIIEEVTLKDSKKRLIKFLLDMLAHNQALSPKSDTLFIRSTREEIAQRLGTARETVARHISSLKRKKLIDVKPYQIIIRDKKGLEALLK